MGKRKSIQETQADRLANQMKNAATSVDTSLLEKSAIDAQNSLSNSLETIAGSFAGEVEGGVEQLTSKFDKIQGDLNNLTVEGLIDDGVQSLENMTNDFINEALGSLTSGLGANVDITFSEPDSNGVVFPIETTLDEEGGVSGTVSAVIQAITGLTGVDVGSLQKVVTDASPEGLLNAGKDILEGKIGAFTSSEALKALTQDAIESVTDELESAIGDKLKNINSVVTAITSVDTDGFGDIVLSTGNFSSTRASDSSEWLTAIGKVKTTPLAYLDEVITESKEIKQNLEAGLSDFENLSGGKDGREVLNSIRLKPSALAQYNNRGEEYRSLVRTRVAKNGTVGITQSLSAEKLTDIKKRIKDFAPRLSNQGINDVINWSQGSADEVSRAVRLLFDKTGKSINDIRSFIKTIDTTITTATAPELEDIVFAEPYVIGSFEKEWDNGEGDPYFPYISSLEELQAELRNIDREVTEVVVHWTETHTNKNIGSEEINRYHVGLGLDGIGYHYVIRRDGSLQRGRPVNIQGQHAPTNNHDERSIAIVFVGGYNVPTGTPNPEQFLSVQSLTRSQFNTFDHFCRAFYNVFPGAQIVGHNDIDTDEIDPGFDVIDYVNANFGKPSKFNNPASRGPFTVDEILS
jgi:hypothetical protein